MTTRLEQAKNFLAKVLTKRVGAEEGGLESITPEATPNFEHLELPRGDQALAQRTFSKVTQGAALSESEQFALEAIIIPDKRPAVDIVKGDYRIVHPDWQSFEEVATKSTIKGTFSSIGRIEVIGFPGLPYGGTGFVVGDNLVMTNRHVAGLFANGVGRDGLMFMPGRASKVDFEYDPDSDQKQLLGVRSVKMIHPYWDMALLEVDGLKDGHQPLALLIHSDDQFVGQNIAVVGYPAFDPRNPADVQNRVFGGKYNVKRLLPGKGDHRRAIDSFGNSVSALVHDASTLGGNSGSALIDPKSGKIVGLHFAGLYLDANFAVPAWELARDSRIIDAGVKFERAPTPDASAEAWWPVVKEQPATRQVSSGQPAPSKKEADVRRTEPTASWTIPIELTVRLGQPTGGMVTDAPRHESVPAADGADETDPAAPHSGEISETADLATARTLTNLGVSGLAESPLLFPRSATEAVTGAAASITLDIAKGKAFLQACENSSPRVTYGLGAKVPFLGAVPGRDFTKVDCSGFVRELIRRATTPTIAFPDGSVNQHDWVRAQPFERSTVNEGTQQDGKIRIAFLRPQDTTSGIGHVVLIHNGRTLESHGGVGPDSRSWTGGSWQKSCFLYILRATTS